MATVKYEIAINDEAVDDSFYKHVIQVIVEENDRSADTFSIRLSVVRSSEGGWPYPAEERLQLFSKVRISASFPDSEPVHLIEGYITGIEFHIDREETKSYVEINGMDATVLMSLKEEIVSWVDKSDSQIAKEIFENYGFSAIIDDTVNPQLEKGSTVIQRGTDIEFLMKLAERNGFECYVSKDYQKNKIIGYFRKPQLDKTPHKDLSVHFGAENNIISIDFSIDGLQPLSVQIMQKDPFSKEIKEVKIEETKLSKLGEKDLSELIGANIADAAAGRDLRPSISITRHNISELQLMESAARSVFDRGSWFIKAKGIVNAEAYSTVLHAKTLVSIKGAGDSASGKYYISRVSHKFKPESYLQEIEARRNALGFMK